MRLRIYKTTISTQPESQFLQLMASGDIPQHSQLLGVAYGDIAMYLRVTHPAFTMVLQGETIPTYSVRGV